MNKLAQLDSDSLDILQDEIGAKNVPSGLADVVSRAIPYIFAFAGVALLVYLVTGGYKLMLSGGDPKKIQEGKSILTNAIVGFIIVFIAFWAVQVFASVLGLRPILQIF